jgi:hypothetical protein
MKRTEALCRVLGWQGGTVHQVEKEIGVSSTDIIYGTPESANDYAAGRAAVRECSLEYIRGFAVRDFKGNKDFWLGVADTFAATWLKPCVVTYRGFLQDIQRTFETMERAVQWARQCGVYKNATFNLAQA